MKCRISAMQRLSHTTLVDFESWLIVKSPACYTGLFEAQLPLVVVQFGTMMRKRKSAGGDSKSGKIGRIAEASCPVISSVTEWLPGCIDALMIFGS